MTDDNLQPNANDRPEQLISEQEMPVQTSRQAPQTRLSAAAQPGQHVVPGRKPLFRS